MKEVEIKQRRQREFFMSPVQSFFPTMTFVICFLRIKPNYSFPFNYLNGWADSQTNSPTKRDDMVTLAS